MVLSSRLVHSTATVLLLLVFGDAMQLECLDLGKSCIHSCCMPGFHHWKPKIERSAGVFEASTLAWFACDMALLQAPAFHQKTKLQLLTKCQRSEFVFVDYGCLDTMDRLHENACVSSLPHHQCTSERFEPAQQPLTFNLSTAFNKGNHACSSIVLAYVYLEIG